MNIDHIDDDPGSGEQRERSEGHENRGGQAGAGKHRRDGEGASNEGGGQKKKDEKSAPASDRPGSGARPARPTDERE